MGRRLKQLWVILYAIGYTANVFAAVQPIGYYDDKDHVAGIRLQHSFDIRRITGKIRDFPLSEAHFFREGQLLLTDEDEEEAARQAAVPFAPGHLLFYDKEDMARLNDLSPWTRLTPETLVAMIKRNIAPETWADKKNSIAADADTLTVVNAPDVMASIAALLKTWRERRSWMIKVTIALVPTETIESILVTSDDGNAILPHIDARSQSLSLTAHNGQTVSAHSGKRHAMITDIDMNCTGIGPVLNPVNEVIRTGLMAEVRPLFIAETGIVHLKFRVLKRRLLCDPEKHRGPFGTLEIPTLAETQLATELYLSEGSADVAGFIEGSLEGTSPLAVLVQVNALMPLKNEAPKKSPQPPKGALIFKVHDVEFLFQQNGENDHSLRRFPATTADAAQWIRHNIAPESWQKSGAAITGNAKQLFIVNTPSVQTEVEDRLDKWLCEALNTVQLGTWMVSGKVQAIQAFLAENANGRILPKKWLDMAEHHGLAIKQHTRIYGLPGKEMTLSSTTRRTFVKDHEIVSGGTGQWIITLPDPIIQAAGSGLSQQCRLTGLPHGQAGLDIHFQQIHTRFNRQAALSPNWMFQSFPAHPSEKQRIKALVPLTIDLPEQDAFAVQCKIPIPWDIFMPKRPIVLKVWTGMPDRETGALLVAGAALVPFSCERGNVGQVFTVTELLGKPDKVPSRRFPKADLSLEGTYEEVFSHDGEHFMFEEKHSPNIYASYDGLSMEMLNQLAMTFLPDVIWRDQEKSFDLSEDRLLALQKPDACQRIASFLRLLFGRRMRRMDAALALVPVEAYEKAVQGNDKPSAQTVFNQAVKAAGPMGMSWHGIIEAGQPKSIKPANRQLVLKDYDVNQTGVMPVINPWVDVLKSGLSANLHIVRTPKPSHLIVQFDVGRLNQHINHKKRKTPYGELDMYTLEGALLEGTILAETGKTVCLGRLSWPGENPGSFVALATFRPDTMANSSDADIQYVDAGCLVNVWETPGFKPNHYEDVVKGYPEKPFMSADALIKLARRKAGLNPKQRERLKIEMVGAGLFLSVPDDVEATRQAAGRIREALQAELHRHIKMLDIRLQIVSIPKKDLAKICVEMDGLIRLADRWQSKTKAVRETAVQLSGLNNSDQVIYTGAGRNYPADVEGVTGGTTHNITQVTDIIMETAGSGLNFKVKASRIPETDCFQVDIEGVQAKTTFGKTIKASVENLASPGGHPLILDQPVQDSQSWHQVVTVPEGRPCLINRMPDPEDPGRTRIVVLEIRCKP